MRTPKLAALGLAFLSPLVGEYLLGNISIRDLVAVPFLVPMYGGGALLIREVTRRTGRGWPTILVLGLAYGVIEPGVFDGSLFNPSFEGMDYSGARIPVLGLSAYYAVQFMVNHAVWSITIPILLTEAITPRHRTTPWLGRVGLGITAVVYVLGGLLIRSDSVDQGEYRTSWAQAAAVMLVALVLATVALSLPRPSPGRSTGWVPHPWLVGVAAFLVSGGYFLLPASWRGVAASLKIIVGTALAVAWLSRRTGWHAAHRIALATGALMTYAWAGFLLTAIKHQNDPVAFIGNGVLAVAAIILSVVATGRVRGAENRSLAPRAGSSR
jgi:hypothetical protein